MNVQPHSGATANHALYLALMEPGDTFLGLDLAHGGHLTHGSPVNFSGILYDAHFYGVEKDTGRIDMDRVRDKAKEVNPKMISVGASAYSRDFDFAAFRAIADEVGGAPVGRYGAPGRPDCGRPPERPAAPRARRLDDDPQDAPRAARRDAARRHRYREPVRQDVEGRAAEDDQRAARLSGLPRRNRRAR